MTALSFLSYVSFLTACKAPATPNPTSVPPILDCAIDDSLFVDLTATLAEVKTVGQLHWETTETVTTYASYILAEDEECEPELTAESVGTEHDINVIGLLPNEAYTVQLVAETANGTVCSSAFFLETGSLVAGLPEATLDTYDEDHTQHGFTFVPVVTEAGSYPTVFDHKGRPVWSVHTDETARRALHSLDKKAVLTLDGSSIRRVGFDGQVEHSAQADLGHTDFVEVEDGIYAILVRVLVEYEEGTRTIMGDAIVEVNAEGDQTQIWSAFDEFLPDLSVQFNEFDLDGTGIIVEDWTHANGISYNESEDAYLVVLSKFEAIAQIDRSTGTMNWLIAEPSIYGVEDADEPHGDFDNGGESLIVAPHSAHQIDESTVVVFNRHHGNSNECSEITEITLDHEAATASRTWTYETEDCLYVYYLGDALPLSGGNTLAIWTTSGRMEQVTPAGESVWRVELEVGTTFGFSDFSESLY